MGNDSTQGHLSGADRWLDGDDPMSERPVLGLAVAWCLSDPGRVGEVATVGEGDTVVVGRGHNAAPFFRIRPRGRHPGPPLEGRMLSRHQLEVTARGDVLQLRNLGSCALKVAGEPVESAQLEVGQHSSSTGSWCWSWFVASRCTTTLNRCPSAGPIPMESWGRVPRPGGFGPG